MSNFHATDHIHTHHFRSIPNTIEQKRGKKQKKIDPQNRSK